MYCTGLSFDMPFTAIAFNASYLDLPIVQDEATVKDFLRTAPENIVTKYKNGGSVSARLRRRLRQLSPGEVPDFDSLAAELNMTGATHAAAIARGGRHVSGNQGSASPRSAIGYLSDSDRSVVDIALELGFSERSAFHRAFQKWTGASPGEFRRGQQG